MTDTGHRNMPSRGEAETGLLRRQVEEQLNRLLTQLQDLEDNREELDNEEYEETKAETMEQLKEFEVSLKRMVEGNMTLVDELGSVQLAIQAAVTSAFKTPEVIKMVARREPAALRGRLTSLEEDVKLGRVSQDAFTVSAGEIVTAMQKLGEQLSAKESTYLEKSRGLSAEVVAVKAADGGSPIGAGGAAAVLSAAQSSVQRQQQQQRGKGKA